MCCGALIRGERGSRSCDADDKLYHTRERHRADVVDGDACGVFGSR